MSEIPAKTPVDLLKWALTGILPVVVGMSFYILNEKDNQIEKAEADLLLCTQSKEKKEATINLLYKECND